MEDYGFRVILAPSFADIFYNNCFKNGMLHPIGRVLDQRPLCPIRGPRRLPTGGGPGGLRICDDFGLSLEFEIDQSRQHILLNGLDDIAMTLQQEDKILAYERAMGIAP